MSVSSEHSAKIKMTLESFVANPEPFILNFEKSINVRTLAAELNFLPIAFEWGSCWGIRPDGEIVVLDFNQAEPYQLETENEPRIRRMVFFQGAKKYPELSELVPDRPADAVDCGNCSGTGIEPINQKCGFNEERIVC